VLLRSVFSFLLLLSLASAQDPRLFPFEPNSGQYPSAVHFIRRSADNFVYLTRDAVVLRNQVRIQIASLDPNARPQGDTPSAGIFNLYQGQIPATWRTYAPMFAAVRWPAIYPGASARFTLGLLDPSDPTAIGRGKLTLVFQPGADLALFRMRVLNIGTTPFVGPSGIWFVGGRVPGVFSVSAQAVQVEGTNRLPLAGSLKIESADTLSIEVPTRNPALPLEVEITFPSYDIARSTGLPPRSADGNRYLSSDLEQPLDFGADGKLDAPRCIGRCTDVVVARLNDQGNPVWVTRFGGQNEDTGFVKASAGGVALTGTTASADLPVSANAPVSTLRANTDVFLASFDPSNGHLRNSTYAGSEGISWVAAADMDSGGDLVAGGVSYQGDSYESSTGYLVRWNPAGNRFVFSRRFDAPVTSIAFGASSRIYFALAQNVSGKDALRVGLVDATGAVLGSLLTIEGAPQNPDTPVVNVRLVAAGDDVWIAYHLSGLALNIAKAAPARSQSVVKRRISYGGSLEAIGFTQAGNLKVAVRTIVPTEVTTHDAPLVAACPDTLYFAVLSPSVELVHATYVPASGFEFEKQNEAVSPPAPAIACLANSAGRRPSLSAAPGQLITLTGGGFGVTAPRYSSPDANGKYPLESDGFRVRIDGKDAPIIALARGLIAVQVPYELEPTSDEYAIQVIDNGRPLNPLPFRYTPEAFDLFDTDERATRSNLAVLAGLNQDGTVNSRTNPAAPGSIVSLFGTGLGRLSPPLDTGGLNPIPPAGPLSETGLLRACSSCEVLYLGSAPGLSTAVVQVNVRLAATSSESPGPDGVIAYPIGIDVSGSIRSLFPFPTGVVYVK
jgi:uncharacterized protein (TIGR03437 family)